MKQYLEGFNAIVSAALALLGVGGLFFRLLASDGWIALLVGERWTVPSYLKATLPIVAVCIAAAAWLWLSRHKSLRRHSDIPLYLFISLGLYMLFKLISTGEL